jgi:hypothetical protein
MWGMVTLPFGVVNVRGNELVVAAVVAPALPQAVLNTKAVATAKGLGTVNLDTGTSSFSLGKRKGSPAGAVLTALPTRAASSAQRRRPGSSP